MDYNSETDVKCRILETDDFYPLSVLFNGSGLEVKISRETKPGTLKMWRCEDEDTGELLGAAVLMHKNGCFVLEDLAVLERCRGMGLGKTLMNIALDEAKGRGATEIWGCAKVPEYYYQYGWVEMDRYTSPDISNCQRCHQFGKTCFPSIIRKELSR